jgi:hypothetical protein
METFVHQIFEEVLLRFCLGFFAVVQKEIPPPFWNTPKAKQWRIPDIPVQQNEE